MNPNNNAIIIFNDELQKNEDECDNIQSIKGNGALLDVTLQIANIIDIESMEKWLTLDKKISLYATESIMGDYIYFNSNPIDEILQYQYKINENVWLLKALCVNEIVGYIVLFYDKKTSNNLTINPIVINPILQGKGYGVKIVEKIINIIKENSSIEIITAGCMIDNVFCIKMLNKLGFTINDKTSLPKFKQYIYKV